MKKEMVHLSAWLLVFAVLTAGCGSLIPKKASDQAGDKAADPARTAGETSNSKSTQENPVPWGKPGIVKPGWEVQLKDINPDAYSVLEATNTYHDQPEGEQYVLLRVQFSNVGEAPGDPGSELSFSFVGNDGTRHREGCGVIPDPSYDLPEMYPGATAEANVCFMVPSKAISGGSIRVKSYTRDEVFFAAGPNR